MYDLVCAELCGWGHYKMKGRLTVESREDYDGGWQRNTSEEQATQDHHRRREVQEGPTQ